MHYYYFVVVVVVVVVCELPGQQELGQVLAEASSGSNAPVLSSNEVDLLRYST